jgi:hypothetical protein
MNSIRGDVMMKKEKEPGYHFRELPDILTLANAYLFYTPMYLILGATMISHLIIRRIKVRGIEV